MFSPQWTEVFKNNITLMCSGLFKLQELVKAPPAARTEMYIRQANPSTYRQVLREIRQKEIFKLIVDTNPRHMSHFFRAVSSVKYVHLATYTKHQVLFLKINKNLIIIYISKHIIYRTFYRILEPTDITC